MTSVDLLLQLYAPPFGLLVPLFRSLFRVLSLWLPSKLSPSSLSLMCEASKPFPFCVFFIRLPSRWSLSLTWEEFLRFLLSVFSILFPRRCSLFLTWDAFFRFLLRFSSILFPGRCSDFLTWEAFLRLLLRIFSIPLPSSCFLYLTWRPSFGSFFVSFYSAAEQVHLFPKMGRFPSVPSTYPLHSIVVQVLPFSDMGGLLSALHSSPVTTVFRTSSALPQRIVVPIAPKKSISRMAWSSIEGMMSIDMLITFPARSTSNHNDIPTSNVDPFAR